MNPCRCGYLGDPARACTRAPDCGRNYCARILGPMIDRFDMIIEVLEVSGSLLLHNALGEPTVSVARRVAAARDFANGTRRRLWMPHLISAAMAGRFWKRPLRHNRCRRGGFTGY